MARNSPSATSRSAMTAIRRCIISSGEVASGALLAVVGPNGAGKSTLFRGIAGILKPLAGTIDHDGLDIRDIAYLPQVVDIDRSFPISVFDFVGTGLWRTTGFFGGMGGRERDRIGRRSPPSASTVLRTAISARSRAGRCSACCLPACCCRMRA